MRKITIEVYDDILSAKCERTVSKYTTEPSRTDYNELVEDMFDSLDKIDPDAAYMQKVDAEHDKIELHSKE